VANFSLISEAKCELLLSSGNRPRPLADVARKFVFTVRLLEFTAEHETKECVVSGEPAFGVGVYRVPFHGRNFMS
jgi:hypothetical protein